jgi:UDP-N-acetylglucosamine--N-acetylmuramyl-(pentapeptide) pyrophosphoryl-undecaprenol N-acetylglucosamine transferase
MAAGGTGGHVIPAALIANELKLIDNNFTFLFLGVGRDIEKTILGPLGYPTKTITLSGLKNRGLAKAPKAIFQAFLGLIKSVDIIRKYRPGVCLATGGYLCGPVGLASLMAGVPLIIHEQNSRPGIANRYLGKIASLIMLGFPQARDFFPSNKVIVTGNPVGVQIAALKDIRRDYSQKPMTVLVLGGSQGARVLNNALPEALASLKKEGLDFKVIHQSGQSDLEKVKKAYQEGQVEARVGPFFHDMACLYKQSHLAVARAGALTVSELTCVKLPAILVPFAAAADDHQRINAESVVKEGGAKILSESEIESGKVASLLRELISSPEKLASMELASQSAAQSAASALRAMAELIDKFMKGGGKIVPQA